METEGYLNTECTFEYIEAGSLNKKDVFTLEEPGKGEYYKVSELKTCKTGKHGAAKVLIKGKVLNNNKNFDKSFTGSSTVILVNMKKQSYVIEDIIDDGDILYMKPNDNSDIYASNFYTGQIYKDDVKKIIEQFDAITKGGKTTAIVNLLIAPNFIRLIEDLKPGQE